MGTTLLTTFAEFEALPDIEGKRELVDGEVVTMPPPDNDHSRVAKRVFIRLLERLGERRVWHDHTGYRLGGGWIEPDVSVSWPDQQRDARYFIGSPMIAVEILSPVKRSIASSPSISPTVRRKCGCWIQSAMR